MSDRIRGQWGPHPDLESRVRRHLEATHRAPLPEHTLRAFTWATSQLHGRSVVLDSGCGTGESTLRLTERWPDAWVVGLDKSEARLRRGPFREVLARDGDVLSGRLGRAWVVRAEQHAWWRLVHEAGWPVVAHYVLYPNPWPKAGHLTRRAHGHPAFSSLVEVGGALEVRTNWHVYATEMARALEVAGWDAVVGRLMVAHPISRFEAKYRDRGDGLFRVRARRALS